jgi:chromosome segregation ATPase
MDKFNFKGLAQKAQEAGTKLAAQVKEQQQKFAAAQKSQEGTGKITDHFSTAIFKIQFKLILTSFPLFQILTVATTSSPQDEFTSETENALRLVQIQNKALRDRLRSAADENERLKDQVHQLSTSNNTRGNAQELINQPDGGVDASSSTSPRLAAVVAENEQLREEIAELKDLVRRAEEHAEIADVANQQVKSLQADLVKEREEAAQAVAAAAAALAAAEKNLSSSPHEQELFSLQQELETTRGDMSVAVAAREAAEAASQQAQEEIHSLTAALSLLKTAQASNEEAASTAAAEAQAAVQASEQLRGDNARLQADVEALQQQIYSGNEEKVDQKQKLEKLEQQLEEALAAREAATAAATAMEEAVATTQASFTSSSEEYTRRIAELEAEVELVKKSGAVVVEEKLQKELEKKYTPEIEALQDEVAQQTALAAAAAETIEQNTKNTQASTAAAIATAVSTATEELDRKITVLEANLRGKEAQLEPLQQELEAAQSGRAAALEELRTELEAQHAQHASQVESLQEQLTRLRTEHADEVDALREEIDALETKLREAKAATVAATEASGEEAVWLREGAQELQRQLDATRVESETAMQALQGEISSLKEQLVAAEGAAAAAAAAAVAEAEAKGTTITEELAALQAEIEVMRSTLHAAEQEVASLKTEAATATAEKLSLSRRITEIEAAAAVAMPSSPPPPSYDALQMQDQLDTLRAENAVALQEAATAAERALISEAAYHDATEQLAAVTTAAAEDSARLRSDVEAAHQRIAELEASLAIAAAATTIPSRTSPVGGENLQPGERQSVIERAGSGVSAATVSPPLSPSSTGGVAGLGTAPMVPHHRRDPSYSSEIEPAAPETGAVETSGSSRPAMSPTAGSRLPPLPPSVPLAPLAPIVLNAGASLEEQIKVLEAELTDSERTHALRDTATAVLKDEIAELRRQQKRAEVDIDYLKAVLVESFASGELNSRSHMLPVLARLLQFSPKDMERALAGKSSAGGGAGVGVGADALSSASAAASALFTRWSATTPVAPST